MGTTPAWFLTVSGAVGLVAAFVLLIEKLRLLSNPGYVPSCSINPVLSCGSIMRTDQAAVFGFPNPVLGVAAFSVLLTVGVVALTGARLPAWFWWGTRAGATFGVVFVHWLIFQSLYRIGALCPYCMVVWVATIVAFVTTMGHAPKRNIGRAGISRWVAAYAPTTVVAWVTIIAALATVRFWDYWSTLAS
jgi:uncharacterized membrane protein